MMRSALVPAILLVWPSLCAAQELAAVSAVPARDARLAQMAKLIAPSVERTDTTHPVFHGCLDWHSAVHGHWALLRIARVADGHRDKALAVEHSLSADGIARESKFLREHPRFEMPYGRAWLLRLALEFELWCVDADRPNPKRLRPVGDEVAESLLAYYTTRAADPNSREYANASWALVQLHAYALHSRNPGFQERTKALVRRDMLEPATPPSFAADQRRSDFFSLFGNWAYLVAKTQDAAAANAFLQEHAPPEQELQPVRLRPGAHHFGMTWSRAWALRALSRAASDTATRERLDRAFIEHVRTGMRQHAAYAGDYGAYDHWVPQFAVYALTE